MSQNLVKLLVGVFASMMLGYLLRPCYNMIRPAAVAVDSVPTSVETPVEQVGQDEMDILTDADEQTPVVVHTGEVRDNVSVAELDDEDGLGSEDDFEDFDDDSDADDDNGEDWTVARDNDSFVPQKKDPPALKTIREANVEVDPKEEVVPVACNKARNRAYKRMADNLADKYVRADKKRKDGVGYSDKKFTAEQWKRPDVIYRDLLTKTVPDLARQKKLWTALESPEKQLDLARLTLIRKVGYEGLSKVAETKMGLPMLVALTSDLDWMQGLLYSGPTDKLGKALLYLSAIYEKYVEQMASPHTRRIATTTALEFAREGWSEQEMMARFEYYYKSFEEGKLNYIFSTLGYWDTRIVTGCKEPEGWGSVRSLTWQRDNVRLPAEGYLGACNQLVYRLRNVAGDSVFSGDYLGPILKHTNNTTAWAHREIGGVCGACSHYGAYGALAAGIPAMTMGEPGHCAYTVRIGNDWQKSYSIYWQHSMHKTFYGLYDWDFLILTQDFYSDKHHQLISDQLLAAAELFASRKMMKSAFNCYDAALAAHPLNWQAYRSYAGYLKQKAADNKERWKELHDKVVANMAVKFHNAAATYLCNYVYPNLLPMIPEKNVRNKMYAAFFKQCATFGTNRWDIAPLLTAQIEGCTNTKEKLAYMKEALKTLMGKPDYAGAVLTWGLDYISKLPKSDKDAAKLHKSFSDMIVRAMGRAKADKKSADTTWAALSEAIYAAATNGDKLTFQAIGKLAYRKCRKNFPKQKMRFRSFPGRVVSAKGLIRTATTIDPGQMSQCCMHWAVLQKHGGNIPAKFEGSAGMTVELESPSLLNGVVCVFNENVKNDRDFKLEISSDGQNWESTDAVPVIAGNMVRVDVRKEKLTTGFVRLLRDGDKWESTVIGFYVYGRPARGAKK